MKGGNYLFPASMLIMLISSLLILLKGLNLGIDFTQGTRFDIAIFNSSSSKVQIEDIKTIMSNLDVNEKYTIKELTSDKVLSDYSKINGNQKPLEQTFSIISQAQFDKNEIILQINKIGEYEYNENKSLYQTIGPKMGSELGTSAKWSLGIAVILILI